MSQLTPGILTGIKEMGAHHVADTDAAPGDLREKAVCEPSNSDLGSGEGTTARSSGQDRRRETRNGRKKQMSSIGQGNNCKDVAFIDGSHR
jgi:hypothetical protein